MAGTTRIARQAIGHSGITSRGMATDRSLRGPTFGRLSTQPAKRDSRVRDGIGSSLGAPLHPHALRQGGSHRRRVRGTQAGR
jgi:hypothetical protein